MLPAVCPRSVSFPRPRERRVTAWQAARRWRVWVPGVLAVILSAAPTAANAAPSAAPPAESKADARARADAALDAGELNQAQSAYADAFAREPSYDIAGNLGAIELALGRHREAAEHLAFALAHFPADGSAEVRSALEERLAQAQQHAEPQQEPFAAPGAARKAEAKPAGTAPLSTKPGAGVDSTTAESGPSPIVIGVGIGLSVAAAAAGAAFAALWASREGLAADKGAALEALALPDPCGTYPDTCDEIRSKQDARDAFGAAAGVAFGVAGAAAIGTLVYALVAADDGDGEATADRPVGLSPLAPGGTPGLSLHLPW